MCEQASCSSKRALLNKLVDEPDTHEFIIIEWSYMYQSNSSTPQYTYATTTAPATTTYPSVTIQGGSSTTQIPANMPIPIQQQGVVSTPAGMQLMYVRATKMICIRCKKVESVPMY